MDAGVVSLTEQLVSYLGMIVMVGVLVHVAPRWGLLLCLPSSNSCLKTILTIPSL